MTRRPSRRCRRGVAALLIIAAFPARAGDLAECSYNGIPLWGNVAVVESFPDLKVRVVTAFPDLDVQVVTSYPDACGKWRFVNSFPDFTIQYVDSFPDIEIRMVASFPGLP